MEIIMERLIWEFDLKFIAKCPDYHLRAEMLNREIKEIYSPMNFPEDSQINKISA